jgi:uncharacterized UPF0160 family protein
MQIVIPKSVGIHDGSFHADEVTACALLLLFHLVDRDKIIRTRDVKVLAKCEYVCDVGGIYDPKNKRFDHHQNDYTGELSSAGMVLEYLRKTEIISQGLYDYFNDSIVLGVDAHDTGRVKLEVGFCSFSQVISNFSPIEYEASEKEKEKAFFEALKFTFGHLARLKDRHAYLVLCMEKIRKLMKTKALCLIFDEPVAWLEPFFALGGEKHPALYIIMPAEKQWKLRCIPPSLQDRMKLRKPLPQEWAGLREKELEKVCKIPGAIFCHKGRFVSIWATKAAALKALDYIEKKYGLEKGVKLQNDSKKTKNRSQVKKRK